MWGTKENDTDARGYLPYYDAAHAVAQKDDLPRYFPSAVSND
jgi:hypothetical protein